MAKAKRRSPRRNNNRAPARRRNGGIRIPLAVVGGFLPLAYYAKTDYEKYGLTGTLAGLSARTTGYNPQVKTFSFRTLMEGMGPIFVGGMVHKVVGGSLGVNRVLGQAGVPFLRV